MVKRSQKIGKFVTLAEAEARRSGELTGRSQSELHTQLDRLGELSAHRDNYGDKVGGIADIDSAHLKDYQNFLTRLDRAVRSQRQIVKDCEKNLELHRRRWMEKRKRLESLEQVLKRYQHEEALQEQRRDQRLLDDMAPSTAFYENDED